MQVNNINSHSQAFGMKCPPRLKLKIANCFPKYGEPDALFKNGAQLADEIDTIGSKNTILEKFNIKRHVGENFYDGMTEVWDECRLLFRMPNPNGKLEKVTAQIRSAIEGEPRADIYKDFVDVTKMAEEEFITGYMGKQARKGNLKETAKGLFELYPDHTQHISRQYHQLKVYDKVAQELKKTLFGRIALFFSK